MEEEDYELVKDDVPVKDDVKVGNEEVVRDRPEFPPEDVVVGKPKFTIAYAAAYLLECPHCTSVFSNRLPACPGCGTVVPSKVRSRARKLRPRDVARPRVSPGK